ncbi:CBU_2007 family Dot/Icm T4SS effector [Coxiella burnetii]|uniref:CBU_2007 family Dot/Icm T4SS effector n=1 Tax=Coxiella burnetii TaxID=777 RepID=UPI0000DAE912|nr:CBU_2007 family Dot/Icm T4SS effector [Coxiella burnetii]ABX78846.1 hypothetical protein COXBURSA331_A0078 [Coxiella burnetii RSA 331]POZ80077.1 hypothetical protein CbuRSA461_00375 [Coxiella burnetii]
MTVYSRYEFHYDRKQQKIVVNPPLDDHKRPVQNPAERSYVGAFLIHCMTLIDMNARWEKYYTEHSEEKPKYFQNPEFNEFLQSSRLRLEIKEIGTKISQGTAQEKTTTRIITKFKIGQLTLVDDPVKPLQVINRKYQRRERYNYDAGVSALYLNILERGYYCGLETLASISDLDGKVDKRFVFSYCKIPLEKFYQRDPSFCYQNHTYFVPEETKVQNYVRSLQPEQGVINSLAATVVYNAYGKEKEEYCQLIEKEVERKKRFCARIDGMISKYKDKLSKEINKQEILKIKSFVPKFFLKFWVDEETKLKKQKYKGIEQLHKEIHENNYDEGFIQSKIDSIKTNPESNSLLRCRFWGDLVSSREKTLLDDIKREAEKEPKSAVKRESPLPFKYRTL